MNSGRLRQCLPAVVAAAVLCGGAWVCQAQVFEVPGNRQDAPGRPGQDTPQVAPAMPAAQGGSPLLDLLPELRRAAAPDWVREGLRVSYHSVVASVLGNYLAAPRDQEIVDPNTPTAGSGESYMHYDLVALDQTEAVGHVTCYLINPTDKTLSPGVLLEDVGPPGAGGCWAGPQVLAGVQDRDEEGIRIRKLTYPLQGRNYDAIRFEYPGVDAAHKPVSRMVYVFDLKTGLLLLTSTAVYSPATRQTQLSQTEYRGHRYLSIPWQGGSVPPGVRVGQIMHFEGTCATLLPGSPVYPIAASQTVQVTHRAAKWTRQKTQLTTAGAPTADGATPTGVRQLMRGYWLPPEAIGVMQQGRVLDQDPLTGAQISVTGVGADERGQQVVQISEQCGPYSLSLNYDRRTGELVSLSQDVPIGPALSRLRLYRVAAGETR